MITKQEELVRASILIAVPSGLGCGVETAALTLYLIYSFKEKEKNVIKDILNFVFLLLFLFYSFQYLL